MFAGPRICYTTLKQTFTSLKSSDCSEQAANKQITLSVTNAA